MEKIIKGVSILLPNKETVVRDLRQVIVANLDNCNYSDLNRRQINLLIKQPLSLLKLVDCTAVYVAKIDNKWWTVSQKKYWD